MEVSEMWQTLTLEENLSDLRGKMRHSHASCLSGNVFILQWRGLSLESGNAPLGISELLWEHSCAAVLNRWNIRGFETKTTTPGRNHPAAQVRSTSLPHCPWGWVFWKRGVRERQMNCSNTFISSSVATAQAGTLSCRACGSSMKPLNFPVVAVNFIS